MTVFFFIAVTGWLVLVFLVWGLNRVRETLRDNPEPSPTSGEWRRLRVAPSKADGLFLVRFEYRTGRGRWTKDFLVSRGERDTIEAEVGKTIRQALIAGALTERLRKGKITHDYRP
jgi:hypothetical protein